MTVSPLDKAIFYSLLLYALASSISIAAANIAVCLALLLAIVRCARAPVAFDLDSRLARAIFVFWATILMSALFAYDRDIAFSKLWAYIYRGLPFFLAAAFVDSRPKLVAILVAMGVSIGAADLCAVWQGLYGAARAKAFSHYMAFAGNLLQMLPLTMVLTLEGKNLAPQVRAAFAAVCLLSSAALIANATRGAWLAVLAAVVLYIFLSLRACRKVAIALCLALAVYGGVFCYFPGLHARAASIADLSAAGGNAERLLLWQGAWRMFMDHPLAGVGPGNFKDIYLGQYIALESRERLSHAHNNFLQLLAENGLIGFAGFTALFAYILAYLYKKGVGRREPLALAVLLATVALLVQGLTEFNFGDSAVIRMYWFLLGLAAAKPAEELGRGSAKFSGL